MPQRSHVLIAAQALVCGFGHSLLLVNHTHQCAVEGRGSFFGTLPDLVAIYKDVMAIGAPWYVKDNVAFNGAIFVYKRSPGGQWPSTPTSTLFPPVTLRSQDFGWHISMIGSTMAVRGDFMLDANTLSMDYHITMNILTLFCQCGFARAVMLARHGHVKSSHQILVVTPAPQHSETCSD